MNQELVLAKKMAAHRLGISTRTLDRLIAGGRIRVVRPSTKRVVIPTSEIDRILNSDGTRAA